jgi:hypothetical protein
LQKSCWALKLARVSILALLFSIVVPARTAAHQPSSGHRQVKGCCGGRGRDRQHRPMLMQSTEPRRR